jgi:hypothetical protein
VTGRELREALDATVTPVWVVLAAIFLAQCATCSALQSVDRQLSRIADKLEYGNLQRMGR